MFSYIIKFLLQQQIVAIAIPPTLMATQWLLKTGLDSTEELGNIFSTDLWWGTPTTQTLYPKPIRVICTVSTFYGV